jgi:hypothetical protein
LQRRRRRLLACLPGEPDLGRLKLAAAEQEARVAKCPLPLVRPHRDSRVHVHPLWIDAQPLHKLLDGLFEARLSAEVRPLRPSQRLWHDFGRNVSAQDRPDPLPLRDGMLQLELAVDRRERVGAQDKGERVGRLDRAQELGFVVGRRGGDVMPVDPHVRPVRSKPSSSRRTKSPSFRA